MIRKQLMPLKNVIRLVVAMITITFVVYLSVTAAFFYLINASESKDLKSRIAMSFVAEEKYSLKLIREYSYWDEAYDEIVVSNNQEWINSNIEEYFFPQYGFDALAIELEGKMKLIAVSDRVGLPEINFPFTDLGPLWSELISHADYKSFFIKSNNLLYRVFITNFISEEDDKKKGDAFIVFQLINETYLDEMSLSFNLPKINFREKAEFTDSDITYSLYDHNDRLVGQLFWEAESSAQDLLPHFVFFGLMILLCSILVSRKILKVELGGREEYEKSLYLSATRDSLTSVYNKRFFNKNAESEFRLLKSENRSYCLVVLDIDYFKTINDRFGHQAGDFSLKEFSEICKSSLRNGDLFGRVGGEEFALFLPDTSLCEAVSICNRIRLELKSHPLTSFGMDRVTLDFSAGLSSDQDQANDFDELYGVADMCLYKAKRGGRGRNVLSKR